MPTEPQQAEPIGSLPPPKPRRPPVLRRTALGAALLAACAVGAGATAIAQRGQRPIMVSLPPAPIASMKDWSPVAVKGQVAEIFGNKFILADDSGRALIETGPQGEGGTLVAKSETVTVQGRFEHGFVHAVAIQHGDGSSVVLGPPGPPPPPRGPQT
ncbi:hypothetical protein [Lichenifustis flavocetrariae]|uniref:DNA-binding protein n=1 Tax=Lichenifustis flavocetrariae TaxID=2949735 RepID=A0AA41YS67_9HYPH|nr:hypothetical protein [Lichenifustis flavocetrariae]MCW6507566.1 hypothetical protein [Lichenifustis flavocetrariae]